MPPRTTEVSSAEAPEVRLTSAADYARKGHITLLRSWTYEGGLAETLAVLGPVFEPVTLPPDKELGPVTHVAETGVLTSATTWHHDQSFATNPPHWSALFCQDTGETSVPTFFCDGAALLSLLSSGFSSMLTTLTARHEAYYVLDPEDPTTRPGHCHPVVCSVEGGVQALFVSPATVESFTGWTLQESVAVLDQLYSMMNWPELTVGHFWQPGDLLIWPNRRYLHRALPVDTGGRSRSLRRVVGHWAHHRMR